MEAIGCPVHRMKLAAFVLAGALAGRRIFPNLTVEENLRAFIDRRNQSDRPWTLPRVLDLFPVLAERARHLGNRLSGGEQQMLAIARARDQSALACPR